MAQYSEDDFAALRTDVGRDLARPLGDVRRPGDDYRMAEIQTWLTAGDNLAEKALGALDSGDEARALRLVQRIIALPLVDEATRSGLMAVNLLLYNEVVDPTFEGGDARGLLDVPLRLLPTLPRPAADALLHVLASITDYELPASVLRRIQAVVPLERRFDPPFVGVAEEALPDAILQTLRLVLLLRADEG
jgi:hypothetical protein